MKMILPDGSVQEAEDELRVLRHTASHVLAQAVKRLYPETKLAIGPAIDDGFYYDFDREGGFTPEDLEKLEAEMAKIVKENLPVKPFTLPRDEAIQLMKEKDEPYKVELIEDLPEGETISFYTQGEFTDLCAGPHILYTKGVKAFKLTSIAGAYWRGSEKNKMLTRIYGTAFANKTDLENYLTMMEEAKKRDHRKLGKELGLFMFAEEGPGFPFFLPKGMTLKNTLIDYWREIHLRENYQEVSTPVILSRKLWETSGHWDHYKDNMYTTVIDEEDYAIKPMNCPGGMLVYKSQPHSYRDLPLRVGELGLVHRHEKSGQLHGLMRVRCFTQDDAHIFMTQEQITEEIKNVTRLINEVYTQFGFEYFVELSTRPEDSMGSDEDWELATNGLRNALEEMGCWMEKNGASIYGCGPAGLPKPEYGRYTRKGNRLYLHVYENALGPLPLPGLKREDIQAIHYLATGGSVPLSTSWVHSDYPEVVFADLGPDPVLPDETDTVLEILLNHTPQEEEKP